MGILSAIFSKIFPSSHPANSSPDVAPVTASAEAAPSAGASQQGGSAASVAPAPVVDIEEVLTQMASNNGQQLNWRTSIVDLMKLLGLDSSLQSRQELAQELHYSGDMHDSASMNIWLHREVMKKVAANGGKVPADLMG